VKEGESCSLLRLGIKEKTLLLTITFASSPHAYGHNGIGAVMSDVSASPSDPIFWMHHSFVDHGFRIWQNMDASRVLNINGVDHQGNALTMDTMVYMGGIRPDVRIGDIMNTLSGVEIGGVPFCYRYTY
jgi:tyrosinase